MEQILARLPFLLLAASRTAGVTTASPVFNNKFIPGTVRVALTFLIALLILPGVQTVEGATEGSGLMVAAVLELLTGLMIGFLSQLLFAVFQMAGALLDMDMGLAMAQTVDPVSNRAEPLVGAFFQSLGLTLYFALNAHHWLLRALADSYIAVPAGGLTANAEPYQYVVYLFGAMLAASVKLALPFIAVMLLTTAVLAAVNRAVAQIQLFQLGLGVKAVAGVAMLMLVLPYLLGFIEPLFESGHQAIVRAMQLMR